MSNKHEEADKYLEIPVSEVLATGRVTESRLANILRVAQPFLNRKKKGNFSLILKVMGTSESTKKTSLIKSKDKPIK